MFTLLFMEDLLSDDFSKSVVICCEAAMVTFDSSASTLNIEDWDMEGFDDLRNAMILSDWEKVTTPDPNQPVVVGPQWEAALPYLLRTSIDKEGHLRYEWSQGDRMFISVSS